jgi:hypothetical protein
MAGLVPGCIPRPSDAVGFAVQSDPVFASKAIVEVGAASAGAADAAAAAHAVTAAMTNELSFRECFIWTPPVLSVLTIGEQQRHADSPGQHQPPGQNWRERHESVCTPAQLHPRPSSASARFGAAAGGGMLAALVERSPVFAWHPG